MDGGAGDVPPGAGSSGPEGGPEVVDSEDYKVK